MSLTPEQIRLVQSTWDIVKSKGDFETHGLTLFERLFTCNPAMYGVFPFAKGYSSWAELSATARLKRHAAGVIKAVDGAVTGLNDLSEVGPVLETLGGKHAKHPIKPEYFGAVGDALLFTLEGGIGDKWNSETKEAWTAVYGIVATVMQKGFNEAQK